jgi:hypothetical protein
MLLHSMRIEDSAMFCYEQSAGVQAFSKGLIGCGCASEKVAPPVHHVVVQQS